MSNISLFLVTPDLIISESLISLISSSLSYWSVVVLSLVNDVIFYFVIVSSSTFFTVSYIETLLPCLSKINLNGRIFSFFFCYVLQLFFRWKFLFSCLNLQFSLFAPSSLVIQKRFLMHYSSILTPLLLVYDIFQRYNII